MYLPTPAISWLKALGTQRGVAVQPNTDKLYTLVGVRADGARPVVDVRLAADDEAAKVIARSFLQEHLSCTAVEIWRGSELVDHVNAVAETSLGQP